MVVLSKDRDQIGSALGRLPSGCSILTVEHGGRRTGMLVSWVQQASFEPLCVTVCVKRGRPAMPLIESAGKFVLNLIGEDPTAMFRHFAKGFTLQEDAFAGLQTHSSEFGPILHSCIAHLGCLVRSKTPAGDHDVFIAEVAAALSLEGRKPYTHLRTTGLSY